MANIQEFIAGAMSHPDFKAWLNGIKFEGASKSLWQMFVEAVAKALGIKPAETSLLEQARPDAAA